MQTIKAIALELQESITTMFEAQDGILDELGESDKRQKRKHAPRELMQMMASVVQYLGSA